MERLTGIPWLVALGWIGLTIFTLGLAVVLYTRWGQCQPLRKCIVLSLLGHVVLAIYATSVRIVAHVPPAAEPVIRVSLLDSAGQSTGRGNVLPAPASPAAPRAPELLVVRRRDARRETAAAKAATAPASLQPPVPLPEIAPSERVPPAVKDPCSTSRTTDAGETPAAASNAGGTPPADVARRSRGKTVAVESSADEPPLSQAALPAAYRLRMAADRAAVLRRHGGTTETEAAVRRALGWLADNQAADGRWDPRSQGAGSEASVQGHDRHGAGSHADAAMTGLAVLAFLGSGHTHREGAYRENVRRGLAYLLENQAADGRLAGEAVGYEIMYCHGMAACALSEAFGMTHDARLREPVRRAVAYTVAAQDAAGGGWRYRPGDPGDTSQLGWQVMLLRSADLAGIPMPAETRQGIVRYLQSVCSGDSGGLASYRPGQPPSRSMTAEALVCWQLLGLPQEHPAGQEAATYLLGGVPGDECNLYYWYYATLAMYQLQGPGWQAWNNALQRALLSRQVRQGAMAGSWETNDPWAGYGGRLYTTTLATLTLEVYYRFLPLYATAGRDGMTR